MDKLLPCPFCGGVDYTLSYDWSISCDVCGAFGPKSKSKEEAIKAWNTRLHDPLMQEVKDVLGFYADRKSYDGHYMMSPLVTSDQGKKARALLKKLEVKP